MYSLKHSNGASKSGAMRNPSSNPPSERLTLLRLRCDAEEAAFRSAAFAVAEFLCLNIRKSMNAKSSPRYCGDISAILSSTIEYGIARSRFFYRRELYTIGHSRTIPPTNHTPICSGSCASPAGVAAASAAGWTTSSRPASRSRARHACIPPGEGETAAGEAL